MERIRGSSVYHSVYRQTAGGHRAAEASTQTTAAKGVDNSKKQDVLELTPDWKQQAENFLEQMREKYPGISIIIKDSVSHDSISRLIARLGKGTHMVVTQGFLERMGSSEEAFLNGKDIMTDILKGLSDEAGKYLGNGVILGEKSVTPWTVQDPGKQEAVVPGASAGQAFDFGIPDFNDWKRKFSIKYTFSGTAASYSRLAGASTKGQVRSAMGEAHRSMASLRMTIAFGEDKDKREARAAIDSLQKLLVRGKRKIRKLDEETLLKVKKNRAQKQNELKKYRQRKLELEKKRSLRHLADNSLRAEGMLDDANRKLQFYEDKDRQYEAVTPDMPGVVLPSANCAAIPGGGSFTASDVVVGEAIPI